MRSLTERDVGTGAFRRRRHRGRAAALRLGAGLAIVAVSTLVPVRVAWSLPRARMATLQTGAVTAPGGTATPFPVSHVAVTWTGDPGALVELRFQDVGRGWTRWSRVEADPDLADPTGQHVYSRLDRVGDAGRVEVRLRAGDARDVQAVAIDTEHGPRHLVSPLRAPRPAGASPSNDAIGEPPIVTRQQWGADQCPRGPDPPAFAPITKLIVHHTDTANNDPDPAGTVRAICLFHTQTRGWNDIGYNFLVDSQGRVYEGRWARDYAPGELPSGEDLQAQGVTGAHAIGANVGSVGVALLGTFDSAAPTNAAVNGLQAILAWKADRHDIDVLGSDPYTHDDGSVSTFPNLSGHRDTSSTSCPGDLLYSDLPTIRQEVANRVAAAHGRTLGYWVAARDGAVYGFGQAPALGDMRGRPLNSPVIGMAATATDKGYWLLGADGGIFSFGDASFFGSTGAMRLNQPVVAMAATPKGHGYWLVASDGGIFAFGDAQFFGSMGGRPLNKPVVGMAATPSGHGYWLVASDGGIFAFGDAAFHGSTGGMRLNSPVVGMSPSAASASGNGYWLVARDGGVFAFDVPFRGSVPALHLRSYAGSAALRSTSTSLGYYVLGLDGGVFTFGDARFFGARAGLGGAGAAADLAVIDPPAKLTP